MTHRYPAQLRRAAAGICLTALLSLGPLSALAAQTFDFAEDPGFELRQDVSVGIECTGGWNPASEDVGVALSGSTSDGSAHTCALIGAALPVTTADDAFVVAFDYLAPELPGGSAFGASAPSFILADSGVYDPIDASLAQALRFEPVLGSGVLELRIVTSSGESGFGAARPQVVSTDATLEAGVWYSIQVGYLPEEALLDLRVLERASGDLVADGVAEDFRLQSAFDQFFLVAEAVGSSVDEEARLDNVRFGEAGALVVDVDVLPGPRQNCLTEGARGDLPVAVLGSADLDVDRVNPDSLRLDGAELRSAGRSAACRTRDLDGDGAEDLLCRFRGTEVHEGGESVLLTLTGALEDGTAIEGDDTVCVGAAQPGRSRRR